MRRIDDNRGVSIFNELDRVKKIGFVLFDKKSYGEFGKVLERLAAGLERSGKIFTRINKSGRR